MGKSIILLVGSREFTSAYQPMIILSLGYLFYLLTFWIRQSLLFNELITYHIYGRFIYTAIFIATSLPLTNLFNLNGLALSLSLSMIIQKLYEYFIYKNKIIPKSIF